MYGEFADDPIAAKLLRRYVGARELLHGNLRYCLWLSRRPRRRDHPHQHRGESLPAGAESGGHPDPAARRLQRQLY
ncbi:type IIL restriction-modification enzyme MmeI [Nocardia asteroides]